LSRRSILPIGPLRSKNATWLLRKSLDDTPRWFGLVSTVWTVAILTPVVTAERAEGACSAPLYRKYDPERFLRSASRPVSCHTHVRYLGTRHVRIFRLVVLLVASAAVVLLIDGLGPLAVNIFPVLAGVDSVQFDLEIEPLLEAEVVSFVVIATGVKFFVLVATLEDKLNVLYAAVQVQDLLSRLLNKIIRNFAFPTFGALAEDAYQ